MSKDDNHEPDLGLAQKIVILTVNQHETRAVFNAFLGTDQHRQISCGGILYDMLGRHGGYVVLHTTCEMGSGGIGGAQERTRDAIEHIKPDVVLAVGIAFGVDPDKQQIGDVLVSKQLQAYELQRVGKDGVVLRGDRAAGSGLWVQRVRAAGNRNQRGDTDAQAFPALRIGLLLSGDKLIDNGALRDAIVHATGGEAIGGEMEGAGLYVAAQQKKTDWLVIKGICDWADNKGANKDNRQKFAARNAACVAKIAIDPDGALPAWLPLEGEAATLDKPDKPDKPAKPDKPESPNHPAALAIVDDTGTMAPDSPWYIARKADDEALAHFKNHGITVALKGCAESGKSSLALRLQTALAADGWLGVDIDLGHEFAVADFATGHGFLLRLAQKITQKIGAADAALGVFDDDGTPSAFNAFLRRLLPTRNTQRLLLTLDCLDAIAGKGCCSEVLNGLRLVHNAQKLLGAKHCVKMTLAYTVRPQQTGAFGSVLDTARLVEVEDFSVAELDQLAARYRLPPLDSAKLHAVLGGHPRLSRLALNCLAQESTDLGLDDLLSDQALKNGGVFKQHLDRLWVELRRVDPAGKLAKALQTLLKGGTLSSEDDFDALLALGLVRGSYSGDAVLRCGLYQTFFTPRLR